MDDQLVIKPILEQILERELPLHTLESPFKRYERLFTTYYHLFAGPLSLRITDCDDSNTFETLRFNKLGHVVELTATVDERYHIKSYPSLNALKIPALDCFDFPNLTSSTLLPDHMTNQDITTLIFEIINSWIPTPKEIINDVRARHVYRGTPLITYPPIYRELQKYVDNPALPPQTFICDGWKYEISADKVDTLFVGHNVPIPNTARIISPPIEPNMYGDSADFPNSFSQDRDGLFSHISTGIRFTSSGRELRCFSPTLANGKTQIATRLLECQGIIINPADTAQKDFALKKNPSNRAIKGFDYFDTRYLDEVVRTLDSFSSDFQSDSLYEKLVKVLPESALEGNEELWKTLIDISTNNTVSYNESFFVTDRSKDKWLLKITNNKQKAEIEAAANYYLSSELDFIVPGKSPIPIEGNNYYITMQKVIDDPTPRSLDYWIGAYAAFHQNVESIFNKYNVDLSTYQVKGDTAQLREHLRMPIDRTLLNDAIDYLRESPLICPIQGDAKEDNRYGRFMVDLEMMSYGHPAQDLALLFSSYNVPKEQWGLKLNQYAACRNFTEQERKDLHDGMIYASQYHLVKELNGIESRISTPTTRFQQEKLQQFLAA